MHNPALSHAATPARSPAATRALSPSRLQPKLSVGAADDVFEREADRVAEQVMRMPSAPRTVQRACATCDDKNDATKQDAKSQPEDDDLDAGAAEPAADGPAGNAPSGPQDEEPKVQRKASGDTDGGGAAPDSVHDVLRAGGRPLDTGTRRFMEDRFGYDFSRVRVHAGSDAARSATEIQAHAYTVGHNVVFGTGRYDGGTDCGRRLLAHELTHVVQQGAAAPLARGTAPVAASPSVQRLSIARAPLAIRRAVATSVAAGAKASVALGACDWGRTHVESVDETTAAVKDGNQWRADLRALRGHYSMQTRLLPSESEVTGPSGNTNSGNFCAQVGELNRLGSCHGAWYMLRAVTAHEAVHAAHMAPSLSSVAPAIQANFNAVTVEDDHGKTAGAALTELQGQKDYQAVQGRMATQWANAYHTANSGDHSGPTAAAEHGIVDPMVRTICAAAKTNSWPACAACPP